MLSCADCKRVSDTGWEGSRPGAACIDLQCPVATTPWPSEYFFWILTELFPLRCAGLTIENDWLSYDEWKDLGVLCRLMDARQQHQQSDSMRESVVFMTMTMMAALKRS